MAILENTHSSSTISYSFYDTDKKSLIIEFNSGVSYIYSDVPGYIYEDFINAASTGKYFIDHIKHSFAYSRK